MKVNDLIAQLLYMRDQVGNVEVRTYSNDFCMDCHKIESVTDGWRDHNDVIGICVTK